MQGEPARNGVGEQGSNVQAKLTAWSIFAQLSVPQHAVTLHLTHPGVELHGKFARKALADEDGAVIKREEDVTLFAGIAQVIGVDVWGIGHLLQVFVLARQLRGVDAQERARGVGIFPARKVQQAK